MNNDRLAFPVMLRGLRKVTSDLWCSGPCSLVNVAVEDLVILCSLLSPLRSGQQLIPLHAQFK